jgi:hypothetical protein
MDKPHNKKHFNKPYNKNYKNNNYYNNKPRRLSEEKLQAIKANNKKIIKKIQNWQAFKFIKHLVCSLEDCKTKLEPKEVNYKVILECPKCKEVQSYIPKVVLKTKFFFPLTLFKNRQTYSDK